MNTGHYTTDEDAARLTARMLLEIQAVHFRRGEPYIFTSGLASPVYIDCRKLISYPRIRSTLMDLAVGKLVRQVGFEAFDAVAGTDGGSKIGFADAIREAGGIVDHTLVVFYYDIFKETTKTLGDAGLSLHYLGTWWDVLAESRRAGHFDEETHVEVEAFLNDPLKLSCLKTNRDDTIVICLSQIDAPVVVDALEQRKVVRIQIVNSSWAMTKAEQ